MTQLHRVLLVVPALLLLTFTSGCGGTDEECGNGTRERNEVCDDGNKVDGDGCDSDCTPTGGDRCQDGRRSEGEACDDGNAVPGDGCEPDCTVTPGSSVCGNGEKEGSEACDDGNDVALDGCEVNCTVTTTQVEQCPGASLPKPATGTCEVTAGDGAKLFTAVVLAETGVLNGGQVLVDAAGDITCVACDCSGAAGAASATRVVCPGAVLSPALINAHDHITFQGSPYRDTTGERYEHRHDWRRGNDGHTTVPSGGSTGNAAIRWGELRQVMAGATAVAGSGGQNGLLRNIDRPSTSASGGNQEGLGLTAANYETFPLGDSGGTELTQGCGYPSIDDPATAIPANGAYLPHIAEGIEQSARNEFLCLSGVDPAGKDLITPRTAVIHGIGLRAVDIGLMAADGAGLIWSPRSNISLYGNTAAVTTYSRLGVRIALGTDWLISGSMNPLRELQCADYLNQSFFGRHFTDEQLWKMSTAWAADVTRTSSRLGRIGVGMAADLAVFRGKPGSPFRAIIAANPDDVVLTMRGGKPLYGDANVITGLGAQECDALEVCQTQKAVCLKSETNETLPELQAQNASRYPLFSCSAPPADEPSCSPARAAQWSVAGSTTYTGVPSADDADGDGIPDAQDNCATVFNPVRPMDEGQQPDQDGDGQGDVCDVCPLDANGTTCSTPNPDDADNDGKLNAQDNCPSDPNPLQEDQDMDGKGDACDACPTANPGNAACPVSVYALKSGTTYVGQKVAVQNLLVTGVARPTGTATSSSGFFAQTVSGDPGYMGADHSGIFVFAPGHTLQPGQRVDVTSATVQNYFGQIQLSGGPTLSPGAINQGAPAPVTVTPAEVATGGARAAALEGVLVRVENVTVTEVEPAPGAGETAPTSEFVVSGGLRVNDLLYLTQPFPAVSETFTSLTGVVDFRNGNSKLEPRGALDLSRGAPVLASIGPSPTYVRVGITGPSFPTALVVSLSSAPSAQVDVLVTAAEPSVTVGNGGVVSIAAGTTSALVPLTGVSQDDSVTLTATLGAVSHTATVRVLGASEPSAVSALECGVGAAPGATVACTVRLDVPPASDAAVTLTLVPSAFGSVPATVTVPANTLSASFDLTLAAGAMGQATVQATFGGQSSSATVAALAGTSGLVINEVDYDQPGADTAEFVEILNASAAPVSLVGLKLIFINGAIGNAEYFPLGGTNRVALDSAATTLQPGEFLLVASAGVAAPQATLRINLPNEVIQNGAPDAIGIYDSVSKTLVDSLSYEGTVGTATVDGVTLTLQEGAASTAALVDLNVGSKSLARVPNGTDTNNNGVDFVVADTPTPAASN